MPRNESEVAFFGGKVKWANISQALSIRNLGRYRLLCVFVLHFEIMLEQTGWENVLLAMLIEKVAYN